MSHALNIILPAFINVKRMHLKVINVLINYQRAKIFELRTIYIDH